MSRSRLAAVRSFARRPGVAWFAAGSLLAHAALAWLVLPHAGRQEAADAATAPIEVELVNQAQQIEGSPPPHLTEPPPSPPAPALPPDRQAALPMPAPQPPSQSATPPAPATTPKVNLGNADEDVEGLSVTGRNVVPPRPDAAVRNKPPRYPADAVRRRAEGTVGLRVHVTELGLPAWVEVIESSGDGSLDRAARDAVARWRFQPARDGARPLAFDYDFEIRFRLGDS